MKFPLFDFPSPKDFIVKPVAKHTESTFRDICTLYIPEAVEQCKRFCINVKKTNNIGSDWQIAFNIYLICRREFQYKLDKKGFEEIRLPNKLWFDGVGDCEDYVIFCSAMLINFGVTHKIRMADYGKGWQHIYIQFQCGKTWHILDACDDCFDYDEQKGKYLNYEIIPKTFLKSKKQGLGRIGVNAETARKEGKFIEHGNQYKRQLEKYVQQELLLGRPCKISFSLDVEVNGEYAIIDADYLQPSHLGAIENPLHFIPEAQPRNRAFSESGAKTPELIAQKLRPAEIIEGSTAYSGCPVINRRGEVIQGNGRAFTMKYYWQNFPSDPKNYVEFLVNDFSFFEKEALLDLNTFKGKNDKTITVFGGTGKKITKQIQNPILVRVVDCTDEEAIKLGQYKQSDLEAIQTNSNQTKSKVNKIDAALLNQILATLFPEGSQSQEKTLSELIRESNISALLIRKDIIRVDEFLEIYINQRTQQVNSDWVKFVIDLLVGLIFKGADTNTPELFRILPERIQTAIAKSAKYILDATEQTSIKAEISNAIRGTNTYLVQKDLGYSFSSWKTQSSIFGSSTPAQEYNPLELELIDLFSSATTQIKIIQKFKDYWGLTVSKSQEDSIFGSSGGTQAITKNEALFRVFGIKINNEKSAIYKIKIRQRQSKAKLLLLTI